jgi:hypothetical protein
MEREEMEPILLEYNSAKCNPPLMVEEVLRVCSSACEYPAKVKAKKSAKRQEENPLYWFKFNLRDWFSDQNINLMTDYQTGWLIRLVAFTWQGGGFLPAEKGKLWRLAKAKSPKAFEKDCDLVLAEFEEVEVQGHRKLKHLKMAAQYAQTLSEWIKKKQAGEASKAKWAAQRPANQSGETIQ